LRCLIGESPKNWESIIPLVEFSYNSSLNRTIKTSHFQVVCGNKPLWVSDLAPFPVSKESVRTTKMIKFMQSIHAQIKERIEHSPIFKEGDLIWLILTKERCPHRPYYKLGARKVGLCKVLTKINDNAYTIQLPTHLNMSNVLM